MRSILRILIVLSASAIIVQAIVLCAATGWTAFTRFPSTDLEAMNRSRGLESLFEQAGSEEKPLPHVESRFTFGWFPAGFDASVASVSTIAGPAAFIILLTAGLAERRRN